MIALVPLALAAPRAATLEGWLEAYARGEADTLWDVASPAYRERVCQGRPDGCPHLDLPLGEPIDRRLSCGRKECTFTRRDRYEAPPMPPSAARELEWRVHTDLEGRYAGVDVMPREPVTPGRLGRWLGVPLGLACGAAATWLVGAGVLLALLRGGAPPGEAG